MCAPKHINNTSMTHRFPIKEIARQAAMGTATVDRVLNNRANVSPQTRARVMAAIDELAAQEGQLAARGRRLFFDFVVEAPARFSREVRAAAEAVAPHIGSSVCRSRFLMQEIMDETEVAAALARIQKRGSHGICLKARDTPIIRSAVNALADAGIPVITLVTDLVDTRRLAYVGLDNAGAGRTAAYLISKSVRHKSGQVLAIRSHEGFLGEEERAAAFAARLAMLCPGLDVIAIQGGSGVAYETTRVLADAVDEIDAIRAVYSMGGGNRATLAFLNAQRLQPDVYIAHDLDQENLNLISRGQLDFVLHHDLQVDLRHAFTAFVAFHRLTSGPIGSARSDAQVITPENIPSGSTAP